MTARHARTATQTRYPWRATARTVVQAGVSLALGAPLIYEAATAHDPAAATGAAGLVLAIAAGITRLFALPWTTDFLARFLPWLAPEPQPEREPEREPEPEREALQEYTSGSKMDATYHDPID